MSKRGSFPSTQGYLVSNGGRRNTGGEFDAFLSRSSFRSLDGIRCASIVAVVWHHTESGFAWLPGSRRGYLGVDMFFVLSGFLIVTLLLRERRSSGSISLNRFYARRALRIFPLYYLVIGSLSLALLTIASNGSTRGPFFRELPFYLTYTANWIDGTSIMAIAWSLGAEEQFYLLWPPVERYVAALAVPALAVVILANQAINLGLADPLFGGWVGVHRPRLPMLQSTFTPICLGVGLAHLLNSRRGFSAARALLGSRLSCIWALAVLLILANLPASDIAGWQRLGVQCAMAVFLCCSVLREDHALAWFLTSRPIRRIGEISYGMYLLHLFARHPANKLLERIGGNFPGALFSLTLMLTVVVASMSYRYYETPFLRLKRRFQMKQSFTIAAPVRTGLVGAAGSGGNGEFK